MKTEPELKKLAEFASGWLRKNTTYIIAANPHRLFENWDEAPILAHLACQEMEKRGYEWEGHGSKGIYTFNFQKVSSKYIPMDYEHDENYFIALWSAIQEALDKACEHQVINNGDGVCIKCGETT